MNFLPLQPGEERNEFRNLDLPKITTAIRGNVLVDGKNILDAEKTHAVGFRYFGGGRN